MGREKKKRGWLRDEVENLQDDERTYRNLGISCPAHLEGINAAELDEEEDGALYDFIDAVETLPLDLCTLEDVAAWKSFLDRYRVKVEKTRNQSRRQFAEYLANKLTRVSSTIQFALWHNANW